MCFCIGGHQGWFPMAFSPLKTLAWNSSIASFTVSRYCNLLVLCLGISRHSLWKTNGHEMRMSIIIEVIEVETKTIKKYIYRYVCVWKLYRPLKYWGALPCWSEVKQSRHDRWKTSPSAPHVQMAAPLSESVKTFTLAYTWRHDPNKHRFCTLLSTCDSKWILFIAYLFECFYLQEVSTS